MALQKALDTLAWTAERYPDAIISAVADVIAAAAEAMGLEAEVKPSGRSEAWYVHVADLEDEDDNGVVVRLAEHDAKSWNGYGDYEVDLSDFEGCEWHPESDGSWRDAVRWLAKRYSRRVPAELGESVAKERS